MLNLYIILDDSSLKRCEGLGEAYNLGLLVVCICDKARYSNNSSIPKSWML